MLQFLGLPFFEWKSVTQQRATEYILAGASPVLIIAPTGYGKTAIALCGLQEDQHFQHTVVVVPFTALVEQTIATAVRVCQISSNLHTRF